MSKKDKAKGGKHDAEKQKDGAKPDPAVPVSAAHGLDERQFLLISKALADPTRTSVLRKIAKGQGACSSMRDCLSVSAATLSHHMKELENAGLITLSREGRFVNAELDRKLWKKYVGELKAIAQ